MYGIKDKIVVVMLICLVGIVDVLAQAAPVRPPKLVVQEDNTWWYLTLFVLAVGLVSAIWWMLKRRKLEAQIKNEEPAEKKDEWDNEALDADQEMEWFKSLSKAPKSKKATDETPLGIKNRKQSRLAKLEKKTRRRKMDRLAFERLPVRSIDELIPAPRIEPLPLSNDDGLLSAIEQAHDEYEDDQQIRELALRILSKFKNRNSIEALSEIALYDLSSGLRSSAVLALADFDHESVFESVLLACADPTREVRAASARALFSLTADRAEAWTRIADCGDDYRMVQAAKAAVASELVDRSIDRLAHEDEQHAYEAFALVALLVRAGETKEIFDVMEDQRNKSVKLAILHCLKVLKDPATLPDLFTYIERNSLPEDLSNAANEVIKNFDLVAA